MVVTVKWPKRPLIQTTHASKEIAFWYPVTQPERCEQCQGCFRAIIVVSWDWVPKNCNFYLFLNVNFWERERACALGMGRERGGQRIQSGLHAESRELNVGFERTNVEIMTWAEVGCLTNWTIQAPQSCNLINITLKKMFKVLFVYFERESESMSREGAERGGREREPQAGSEFQHRTWCGAQTHRPWDHELKLRIRHLTNWATQAPQNCNLINITFMTILASIARERRELLYILSLRFPDKIQNIQLNLNPTIQLRSTL